MSKRNSHVFWCCNQQFRNTALVVGLLVGFFVPRSLHAQLLDSSTFGGETILRLNPAIVFVSGVNDPRSGQKVSYLESRSTFAFGIRITKYSYAGPTGLIWFVASNTVERPTYAAIGYWGRVYLQRLDKYMDWRILGANFQLHPFIQWSHVLANFRPMDNRIGTYEKTGLNNHLISPAIGLNYNLFGKCYLEVMLRNGYFLGGDRIQAQFNRIKPVIGFNYFLGE